jgi:hypothetical protein
MAIRPINSHRVIFSGKFDLCWDRGHREKAIGSQLSALSSKLEHELSADSLQLPDFCFRLWLKGED